MRSRGDGERLREQSRYVLAYHEWAGSFLSRLGGTAGVFYPLLSQFTQCVLGQERFLFFPLVPQARAGMCIRPGKDKPYEDRSEDPVQVLSGRIGAAHRMVQCAGRYEKQACSPAEPRHHRQQIIPETSSPLTPPRGASCAGVVLYKTE